MNKRLILSRTALVCALLSFASGCTDKELPSETTSPTASNQITVTDHSSTSRKTLDSNEAATPAMDTLTDKTDIQPTLSRQIFALDTFISLNVNNASELILDECSTLISYYESLFSRTIEQSDIWRINHANGQPTVVAEETADVIEAGIRFGEISNGKFDITIAPVSELWDFKTDNPSLPNKDLLAQAVELVNYRDIILEGNTVTLKPGMALDLGAIAKGYIADRLADYLRENSITSAMINLGGNVYALGQKSSDELWRVGVQGPFEKRNEVVAAISAKDLSVVTSGIYERYFELDGGFYHHLFDTETGYPIDNELAAVCIVSELSVDGEGYSTTCFAMGLEEGLEFIESQPDIEAVFVTRDDKIYVTSGFDSRGGEIPIQFANPESVQSY